MKNSKVLCWQPVWCSVYAVRLFAMKNHTKNLLNNYCMQFWPCGWFSFRFALKWCVFNALLCYIFSLNRKGGWWHTPNLDDDWREGVWEDDPKDRQLSHGTRLNYLQRCSEILSRIIAKYKNDTKKDEGLFQ